MITPFFNIDPRMGTRNTSRIVYHRKCSKSMQRKGPVSSPIPAEFLHSLSRPAAIPPDLAGTPSNHHDERTDPDTQCTEYHHHNTCQRNGCALRHVEFPGHRKTSLQNTENANNTPKTRTFFNLLQNAFISPSWFCPPQFLILSANVFVLQLFF